MTPAPPGAFARKPTSSFWAHPHPVLALLSLHRALATGKGQSVQAGEDVLKDRAFRPRPGPCPSLVLPERMLASLGSPTSCAVAMTMVVAPTPYPPAGPESPAPWSASGLGSHLGYLFSRNLARISLVSMSSSWCSFPWSGRMKKAVALPT